jgi:molybdate transport system substrate-binding protein
VSARDLSLALAAPPVPAGRYAREYLSRVGLLDELEPRIVNADNVRAALAMVESGAADCALVYLSDARAAPSAQLLWTATAANNPDIVYVAAALSRSASPWADAYLDWLGSEAFMEAAESRGFLRPR